MENLFWGSSTIDLKITIFLLIVSFLVSLSVFIFAKRKCLALLLFSIISNAIFLMDAFSHSEMFRDYGIMWLGYFSLLIWPIINIILIIYYAKTSPKKK